MNKMRLRKPNLFIVGASKSGTTALYHFLKQHPDIFMSEKKEPRFFCKDGIQRSDKFYEKNTKHFSWYRMYKFQIRNEKDYLNLFSGWKNEKIAGEASLQYLKSKVAAQEIRKFNPDAKIIIMIRNPVDWLYSKYSKSLWDSSRTVKDFKSTLRRRDLKGTYFSTRIQQYFNVFDKKKIKIIIFDDFKKDNAGVYKEVLKFLGVEQNFAPKFHAVNPNKTLRFTNLHILLKSSPLTKLLVLPKHTLPKGISTMYSKMLNFVRFGYFFLFTRRQRPPMDPRLRKELMKRFKPEVERLSKLVNEDLIFRWGYNSLTE